MKMTLNLTSEDVLKVIEALKKAAIETGWVAEELDDNGIIEEYSRAVDAALTAMGFDICIDTNPSCEDEDEDEEEDEEDFNFDFDDDEKDEDEEEDDEELPSDEDVMNLIMQVFYGQ